ncbi:MAG: hypothetical protein HOL03_06210 [Acidiferrobacteraceae bacterium]|jgi:hypothetical protein|nr:hypothetical protein [Acidiferrobacteraceae bacterium]MBT5344459.1 hypothetical protein [Acidiferrobacteraceae bacterium]
MRSLKTSIFAATTLFAISNFAAAGSVVPSAGYGLNTTTSSTATPLADGSTLIQQTTQGFWIETTTESNFPSEKVADCNATMLLSAEGAPIAYRSVCTVTDIDGDLFVATIGATKPDFSDCAWTMHGGTGKYTGVTGGGACMPGGPITKDGNSSKSTWTGEWVLP